MYIHHMISACARICIHIHSYVCVCICIHIRICIHIHLFEYKYIHFMYNASIKWSLVYTYICCMHKCIQSACECLNIYIGSRALRSCMCVRITYTHIHHHMGVTTVSRIDSIIRVFCRNKLQVSFAEYSLFYMALLQKRPIILSILPTEATPISCVYRVAKTHRIP